MRLLSATAVAALSLALPLTSWAKDTARSHVDCDIHGGKNDLMAKGKDVVVEAGKKVDDAVAVDGNVIVRKGARVRQAVALHGSVTVEAGAHVDDSAVAIGGKVKVANGGHVGGSQVSVDQGLHVVGEDGQDLNLSLSIDGKGLADTILAQVLEKTHSCRVTSDRADAN